MGFAQNSFTALVVLPRTTTHTQQWFVFGACCEAFVGTCQVADRSPNAAMSLRKNVSVKNVSRLLFRVLSISNVGGSYLKIS